LPRTCCEDCELKDEGKTSVWLKSLNRHKEERAGEADRQNIKTGYYGTQTQQSPAFRQPISLAADAVIHGRPDSFPSSVLLQVQRKPARTRKRVAHYSIKSN
jgi:hypothetical protein